MNTKLLEKMVREEIRKQLNEGLFAGQTELGHQIALEMNRIVAKITVPSLNRQAVALVADIVRIADRQADPNSW